MSDWLQGKNPPPSPVRDGSMVQVHILDLASDVMKMNDPSLADDTDRPPAEIEETPASPPKSKVEQWEIGKQIGLQEYQRVKDPTTGEVYVIYQVRGGKTVAGFCRKGDWNQAVMKWESMT